MPIKVSYKLFLLGNQLLPILSILAVLLTHAV